MFPILNSILAVFSNNVIKMVSFHIQTPFTDETALNLKAAAATATSLQLCPTLCDPTDGGPPGSRPWDSPGKNTGMGCHFLLQCMKVKRESEVAQSWEWVAISFSHA